MRWTAVGSLVVVAQLVVGTALAAGGTTGKGETGNKGGKGPGSNTTKPDDEVEPAVDTPRKATATAASPELVESAKPWEIGASAEFHRLIRQNDLQGAGAYKVLAAYSAYARYDLTKHDRISIREFLSEKFIADNGETGLRLGDLAFSYTRIIPLPDNFGLFITGSLTAPTSFNSRKSSLYTAPGLTINGEKRIGYLTLSARASGGVFLVHYREAEGGSANPKYRLSFGLDADVQMPFHEPLSLGISGGTGYVWFYRVATAGSPNQDFYGNVGDVNFANQPVQQSYGAEVYARYTFPEVSGFKMDLTMAYAQGDPALGFTSVLHDGVSHTYLFVRENSSVYGVFGIRY